MSGPWGSPDTPAPASAPALADAPHEAITAARVNGTDFLAAQRDNRVKTWVLILVLINLGFFLGYVIGWALEAWGSDSNRFQLAAVSGLGLLGGALLAGIGVVSAGVTLAFGDKLVLSMNGAREVTPEAEPRLHNVVEEMAIAAGLPKPKVYIMESAALNAFATGLSPQKSAIAVTRGLLDTLNREQLQGVVAHEMGHVLNLDTRYMVAVGIMVGLIALVSDVVLRSMRFGSFRSSGSSRRDSKGGGGAAIIVLVIMLVFLILAPIAAQLVRFAVSRQREYLADATSVQLTRNPVGLIGALEVLGAGNTKGPEIGNRATQHLFIVNPLKNFGEKTAALFATHPSIAERIQRLQNLGKA
ncbi:M48 family metallopeptidase [Dongia sedimenti]|uniref:Protease HtpX homolog n=1 Tax=Dongia sedimenti TaxID=3064282 RepID=A0ABU0YUA8_9PROT|nr:M48 family metallopeptidase [Rhodospirillaceae bacterium R-7]